MIRMVITLGCLILICSACQTVRPMHAVNTKRFVNQGVEVSLSVPALIASGKAIEVKIKLVNVSNDEISYLVGEAMEVLRLRATDARGHYPSTTKFGQMWSANRPAGTQHLKIDERWLEPGQSVEWTEDLSRVYELRKGQYELSLTTLINCPQRPFVVKVEGIKFRVM
jgi:hypothetical protein